MLDAAALRVIGTEKQPPDPRQGNRLGAHGAGLERDIQIAVGQPRCGQFARRYPDRQQFRMGRRVTVLLDPVSRNGDYPRRRPIDDHGADRHIPHRGGFPGCGEGLLHIACVFHPANGARESVKLQRRAGADNCNDA